eukprot:TRINITY_DN29933_c0_g1_i1.p1 TRINITY_DN29933_c0_g1~~TRINITY_DN29933_c0_g1_i1.p1  ORF type:complete len:228 (+),score=83.99 TRINITY_DN29933_c0_g1_i1:51-734(+)
MPPNTEAMPNCVKPSALSLLSAAIHHLTTKTQGEHLPHLTSLQAVHDAPQPHLLARFGESGVLDQVLTQRLEFAICSGELTAGPLDGGLTGGRVKAVNSPSCYSLVLAAVRLAVADAQARWEDAQPLLAETCTAYGIRGKQNILEAKKNNFFTKKVPGKDAYYVNMFSCDPDNRVVTFQYECFLKGMEGKGTELVFFQEDMLISKVICIRHKESQPDLFKSCPLCSA